jgi:hypothetical protein
VGTRTGYSHAMAIAAAIDAVLVLVVIGLIALIRRTTARGWPLLDCTRRSPSRRTPWRSARRTTRSVSPVHLVPGTEASHARAGQPPVTEGCPWSRPTPAAWACVRPATWDCSCGWRTTPWPAQAAPCRTRYLRSEYDSDDVTRRRGKQPGNKALTRVIRHYPTRLDMLRSACVLSSSNNGIAAPDPLRRQQELPPWR